MRENNSSNLIKKSKKEEKVIYEHIQQKIDHKKSFSVSDKDQPVKQPSNSPCHKSDSEIDNVKPDMHDKLLDKSEIDAGMSIFLSNVSQNRFKLTISKSDKSNKYEKASDEFFYCIKDDGLEFGEKIVKQRQSSKQ